MKKILIFYVMLTLISCNSDLVKKMGVQHKASDTSIVSAVPKELSPVDYAAWIQNEEAGLKLRSQHGAYKYELQYQPPAYLVVVQERTEQIEEKLLREEINKRGDLQYFSFKMSTIDGKGILSNKDIAIDNRDSYLLSGLQQDIKLVEGTDTLNCVMLHFESSNNLIPYDNCVLAFEKSKHRSEDLIFLYNTHKYDQAWVRIIIERKNINRIPKLKTN
ncbi:MAG: hypothetical protein LBR81_01365 [Prevotellaceae bacterium]|jgi:hypothetical protein|nr:hypothetical protein [Prevotellaceae bacterium]